MPGFHIYDGYLNINYPWILIVSVVFLFGFHQVCIAKAIFYVAFNASATGKETLKV